MSEIGDRVRNLFPLGALRRRSRLRKPVEAVSVPRGKLASEIRFCPNCGEVLSGPFCAKCGQKDADLRRSVWSFLWELTEDFVTLESRFLRTIGLLIFLPGVLTKSYFEGKRARYVPPVRLYLIISLMFFLALTVTNVAIVRIVVEPIDERSVSERVMENVKDLSSLARLERADPETTPGVIEQRERVRRFLAQLETNLLGFDDQSGERSVTSNDELASSQEAARSEDSEGTLEISGQPYRLNVRMFSALEAELGGSEVPEDFLKEPVEGLKAPETPAEKFGIDVIKGFRTAALEPEKVNDLFNKWIPRGMILLLPLFGLMMRAFYWGKNNSLIKQLIFSLHFHSYIFAVLTLLLIAQFFLGSAISGWIFLAAVPLYLLVAMKVLSGQTWLRTAIKYVFIASIYSVALATTVGTITLFGLAEL